MKLFRYKGWYIERTTILVPNYQPSFYNEAFHQLSSWFFSGYWNWSQLQPEHYGSTFLSNWTLKIKTIYSMFWTPTYNCLSYYSILVSKNSGTLCQRYAQTLQRIKNTNYLQAPKIPYHPFVSNRPDFSLLHQVQPTSTFSFQEIL